jgi:hypothetical protein
MGKWKRLGVVVVLALAALVLARHLMQRGLAVHRDAPAPPAAVELADSVPPITPAPLERGARSAILAAARGWLAAASTPSESAFELPASELSRGEQAVVVSLSRSDRPALVEQGRGEGLQAALGQSLAALARRASPQEVDQGLLKIDLLSWTGQPEQPDGERASGLDRSLDGLWLLDNDLLLLPEELLAWRLVDSNQRLRDDRLAEYLAAGGRSPRAGAPRRMAGPYRRLRFDSFIEGAGGEGLPLRLFRGNPLAPDLSPQGLRTAAVDGGEYLLRNLEDDGWFRYTYEPKRDSYEAGYNLLRHAGSCYALAQLSGETGDPRYLAGARRGLEALLTKAQGPRPEDAGEDFEAIVSPGQEAKLGGAALTMLALLEYQQASGEERYLPRTRALARFLLFRQEANGHFISKYFYGEPDPQPFESIYYPGEAILALLRLYAADSNPAWLAGARRGADWLIDVRDRDAAVDELAHDHWLLMALNELDQQLSVAEPQAAKYRDHAAKIAAAILGAQRQRAPWPDWIGTFYDPPRSTPTATRAEAMVAMVELAQRHGQDTRPYLESLLKMAAFERRTQLTRENALYLRRPDLALGGFRRSLDNWEVRIDYVQHNVSALLGLRRLLA